MEPGVGSRLGTTEGTEARAAWRQVEGRALVRPKRRKYAENNGIWWGGCGQNGISAKKLSELIVFALDLCHLCRYNRPKWLIVSEKWARFFDHAAIKYTDVYANFEKF